MTLRVRHTLMAILLLLVGCDDRGAQTAAGDPPATGGAEEPNLGSFSLSLTLGAAYRFGRVDYDVSGGNGFDRTGSLDATGSTTVTTIIPGIPFGGGYVVRLTAQDLDHKLDPCTGSATFNLPSGTIVSVPVHLTCREKPAAPAAPVPIPRWSILLLVALLLAVAEREARRARR